MDSKQEWSEVGEHFNALGEKLKAHGKQDAGEAPASVPDQAAVTEALNTLGRAIDQAVSSASSAVKDPAMRDDLRNALNSMGDALNSSFADMGETLGDTLKTAGDKVKDALGRKPSR
jgi:ABC-type transporter Mla subunit MlaD